MLITGASRGIGKVCAEFFKEKYEVITVARTGDVSVQGDLTDSKFISSLVQSFDIDILINNAGIIDTDFAKTFELNVMAAGLLATGFYEKMNQGHIINLCSTASTLRGWSSMSERRIWYLASKASLKSLSTLLHDSRKKNIKVTSLEPAWVNTDFAGPKVDISENLSRHQRSEIIPMKPEYIAQTIDWILNQPDHVVVNSLQIDNFYIKAK